MTRILSASAATADDLVCVVGQSNAAGHMPWNTYDTYPVVMQQRQPGVMHAHYISNDGTATNATWHQMQPKRTTGSFTAPIDDVTPKGSFTLPLGHMLQRLGCRPAIAQYAVGGTGSDYWNTNKATAIAWFAARKAELTRVRSVSLVVYQGETNAQTVGTYAQWGSDWTTIIAAFDAAFSGFTVRHLIVRLPDSLGTGLFPYLVSVQGQQVTLAGTLAHGGYVTDNTATMGDGVHLSSASQLTIGYAAAQKLVTL